MESDVCPSGPSLGYWIGRVALFVMPADMALSEKSPHLGGTRVTWIFRRPECSPMTSEVGTDLRAVRPRGTARRDCLPWRVPYFCPVRWSVSAVVCVCGRGAFGEIALPRRCLGEVGFSVTPGILAVVDVFKLRIIVWPSSHHPLSHCKQRGTQGFPLVPGQPPGHSHGR